METSVRVNRGAPKTREARVLISYCRGAGSVLDLAPKSRCVQLVPHESFNERLHLNFHRVGGAMRHGVDCMQGEASRNGTRKASA